MAIIPGLLKQAIDNRTVTPIGLSVGTGIALESLFDIDVFDSSRKGPDRVDPTNFETHIFNIYTLFRNVVNSVSYKDKELVITTKLAHNQLLNDMYLLIELYKDTGIDLVFYLPNYSSVYAKFNKNKPAGVYKPYNLHSYIVDNLKRLKFPGNVYNGTENGLLPPHRGKVLIMTHFTMDLLSVTGIPGLHLLESHTGKIKSPIEWGSKYHPIGKRDLSIMPMNKKLLYILGDKTIVKPLDLLSRRTLHESAIEKKWTPLTGTISIEKVVSKIQKTIPV